MSEGEEFSSVTPIKVEMTDIKVEMTDIDQSMLGNESFQTAVEDQSALSAVENEKQKWKKRVAQLEEDLQLAAQIGKQLLGNNHDLTKQLESTTQDYTSRIEALEQERHIVQVRLDHKVQQSKDITDELEYLKTKYESQKRDFEMRDQTDHLAAVNQFKKQVATLQSELEASQLMTAQLEQKQKEAEERTESLQRELTEKMNTLNETCSEEMAHLHSEVNYLSADKRELTAQLSEVKREVDQLRLALTQSQSEVKAREAEVEEQQCQVTAYFNTLERSREEVQELKVELDMMRMESQDQKSKGNSLFGEVEDRRIEAEKKMISLRVQNDTLKKQYSMTKDNLHKLKLQMATLLQMSTGRADTRHLGRIQEQLDEARSEVAELTQKLAQQKKAESCMDGVGAWKQLLEQHGQEDYANFVKALIKNKDEEVSKMEKTLTALRLQEMGRTQQLLEYEKKAYEMDREKERLLGLTMQQQLRIDELHIKYEPDKHKASRQMTFKAERLPPRAPPKENKENESRQPAPRPMDAPDHIKASLQPEVMKDTVPSAAADNSPDITLGQTLADMTVSEKAKPIKSLQMLRNAKGTKKVVTLSPEVEVREIEVSEEAAEREVRGPGPTMGKIKGGKVVVGKSVKVKAAQPQGQDGAPECKTQ